MKKISFIVLLFLQSVVGFSQASNIGFELSSPGAYSTANGVSGWTLSSQTATCGTSTPWTAGSSEFSIVSTPIISFPTIGNIGASPLGGNNVARLNNSIANSSRTKLVQTFSVNSSNPLLIYSFAGVWGGPAAHNCCELSGFTLQIKNSSGTVLPCYSVNISPGPGCSSSGVTYSVSSTAGWTNWQTAYVDLSPYINSYITIEVTTTDCSYNDHFGTLFFDALLSNQFAIFNTGGGLTIPTTYPPNSVCSWCPGSNIAQISAPIGYSSYQWSAPGTGSISAPQGTMTTLSINNPIANSVYTVMMVTPAGCVYTATYAISPSTVQVVAIAANSTCIGGSSGSATVVANGSGSGYNYTWLNSTNSVVSTSSVVNNLAPGIYTVQAAAAGSSSSSCGTSSSTLAIGVAAPGLVSHLKPFCNNEAYLCAGTGTNYQWYYNSTAITSSLGGTNSCYTITSATNSMSFVTAYSAPNGCRDSVQYILVSTNPGFVAVTSNPIICQGASNGSVTLNMSTSAGALPGFNWFSIVSTGSTSAYTASINPTSSNIFTTTNLAAGGTYSVSAFDGACKYVTSFSVTPYVFNFTLNPTNSPTLCGTNAIAANVTFTNPTTQSQYSYSWTPSTFLIGTNTVATIIAPTLSTSSLTTIVYTVVVTPTLVNCPLSKTLAIAFANPQTPTITAIPALCSNGVNYSIQVNPIGGNFINGSGNSIYSSGILNPSLASIGVNTFTYANTIGTCVAKSTASYVIIVPPSIGISGNTLICEGQSTSLLANGPASFTWNTIANGPVISVNPSVTTIYTVTGYNSTSSCQNTNTITVKVLPLPHILISGDTLLCIGETITLNASGANSYSWNTGSSTQNISVSPIVSTNYSVVATSTNGNCSDSKVISIVVSACMGIDKTDLGFSELKIYPNPTNENLFIETETTVHMFIFDNLGKLISEKEIEKGIHSIDLGEYNSGVYFLKISDSNSQKVLKLIKTD